MNLAKYHDKGYTGLVNLGNTCFLNSCLQVLSHTYELDELLNLPEIKKLLKEKSLETVITKEWMELLGVMWNQNGVVSPNRFVHNVQKIAKKKDRDIFTGWNQNDMTEFLLFIVDCFHTSLSRPVKIKITGKQENNTDLLAIKCYEMLKDTYNKEYSEVMELFYGIYVSEIKSLDGKQIWSIRPEHFFILDLPIPRTTHNGKIHLIDCFDAFIRPELLVGENAWYNENTKNKENIQKGMKFWNFPDILIITLKRFSVDGKNSINDYVDIPLQDLNLARYIHGYNANKHIYDLYAVCNYVGNVNMGHYTAFVKNVKNEWVHYNDQQVNKMEKDESIITPMAYCLFYRKKISKYNIR